MRTLWLGVVAVASVVACAPPCDAVTPRVLPGCRMLDGGHAGQPFRAAFDSNSYDITSCTAVLDGGAIDFVIVQSGCSPALGAGAANRAVPQTLCDFPALDAGTYFLGTLTPSQMTVPADGGFITCP